MPVFRRLCCLLALTAAAALIAPTAAVATPAGARRIVTLVPSLAEDLYAIGAGAQVVGVSAYSDYPAAARALPVVAGFATISTERILALHPDVVVGIVAQARLTDDLRRAGIRVVLLRDDSLADLDQNLRALGALSGRGAAADALLARLRARTAALTRTVRARRRRPTVFVVLGTAPIFTVGQGSYIARLIELAGGANAAGDLRVPYGRYSGEALLASQPDVLVVDPAVRFGEVLSGAPWNALRAVREHRVSTLPDAAILERPGPRYNEGLAWLIDTLNHLAS
ncbi:MAG TPA: helical backbone metal receptor [Candidatus Limnocylindria bacterium]|nr:helical backbone metal receptor [Candidatus Limnocylindria bacterium]